MSRDKRPPGIGTAFRNFDYEEEIDRLKRTAFPGGSGGGTAGPPGPTGPAGPAGPASTTFVYTQVALASTWMITHNSTKIRPSVTVVDSGDNEILANVQYISDTQIAVSFSAATSGKAYLN
jgi:hypothetical protein